MLGTVLLGGGWARAQQAPASAPPAFAVISIKPVSRYAAIASGPGAPARGARPGGGYVEPRTTLAALVQFAYSLPQPSFDLAGVPEWGKSAFYAIEAKPADGFPDLPADQNREQVRFMVQAMLADRFQLAVHHETRPLRGLKMTVGNGGLKAVALSQGAADATASHQPTFYILGPTAGRIYGKQVTMAGLAQGLSVILQRPVADDSGLTTSYDFRIQFSAPADAASPQPGILDFQALVISELGRQMNLHFTDGTVPTDVLVVDHAEPPAGN